MEKSIHFFVQAFIQSPQPLHLSLLTVIFAILLTSQVWHFIIFIQKKQVMKFCEAKFGDIEAQRDGDMETTKQQLVIRN